MIINEMKNIAIIPFAYQKRIQKRTFNLFGGLPLLVHLIQYALANSRVIDDVYVSPVMIKVK
jgi:N-acylneuraminate cytidylyltransferase